MTRKFLILVNVFLVFFLYFRPESPLGIFAAEQDPLSIGPKSTVEYFLEQCRDHNYAKAVTAIGLDKEQQKDSSTFFYTRRLCMILDGELTLSDIDKLPQQLSDEEVYKLAVLATSSPSNGIIRLVQKKENGVGRWIFANDTFDVIRKIIHAKGGLQFGLLQKKWDDFWQNRSSWEFNFWRWISLPTAIVLSLLIGYIFFGIIFLLLTWLFIRKFPRIVSLAQDIKNPILLALTSFILQADIVLPFLYAPVFIERLLVYITRVTMAIGLFGCLWRLIDSVYKSIKVSHWIHAHPQAVSLLPFGKRILRLFLAFLTLVVVLKTFGYQVSSLLAGFGLSGVVLALAAQKTMEQLFSGLMLSLDQPFRVGDTVRMGEIQGVVEKIGLRSTRIRTLDRTQVTIPNAKLTESPVETLNTRDKTRYMATLRFNPNNDTEQLKIFLGQIKKYFEKNVLIWREDVRVYLHSLGDSSLDVEVMVWFLTSDTIECQQLRQEIAFTITESIQRLKLELAPQKANFVTSILSTLKN